MKRWAALVSFVLFLALCASVVAWGLYLFRPASRPVAAAPAPAAPVSADLNAAVTLFGARAKIATAPASNYVLKGVVVARKPSQSVAILAATGKPAQAVGVGVEVDPGVIVQEVHSGFVVLSENGQAKRVELAELPATQPASPQSRPQAVPSSTPAGQTAPAVPAGPPPAAASPPAASQPAAPPAVAPQAAPQLSGATPAGERPRDRRRRGSINED